MSDDPSANRVVFLRSERLWFRAPEEADAPLLTRWFNEPEARVYLDSRVFPYPEFVEKDWIRSVSAIPNGPTPNAVCLLFGRDGEAEPIGTAGLISINWIVRSGEYGILIGDPENWNQGVGTEVADAIVRYAFFQLNLQRVMLRVRADNLRGIRSYEKTGFQEEGRLRHGGIQDGKPIDIIVMGLLREEWKGGRGGREKG